MRNAGQQYNMAPLMPWPLTLAVAAGVALGWRAFRQRDPVMSIIAWLFFVPYIAPYSLFLPFSLLAIRYRRLALLISALTWAIYGGALVVGLLLAG